MILKVNDTVVLREIELSHALPIFKIIDSQRSYPGKWATIDAVTKQVLKTYDDGDILVASTNTPDLREPGRLVQKSVDERAIRARKG